MFCPKCGQQQVTAETRFCSRCGFQLGVVKAILAPENAPEASGLQTTYTPERKLRKRDMTVGALLMFFAAFVVAVLTIDFPSSHSMRIIGLFVAWLLLTVFLNIKPIVGYFFQGEGASGHSAPPVPPAQSLFGKAAQSMQNPALPPAHSQPAPDFTTRANTAEVVPPPSVTEQTTNLLNKP